MPNNYKYLLLLPLVLFVAGCQTQAENRARIFSAAQNQCSMYGFKPGTDAYSMCLQQADQNLQAADSARRQALMQQGLSMMDPNSCTSYNNCVRVRPY